MPALLAFLAGLLYAVAGIIAHAAVLVVAFATGLFDSPVILDTVSWGLMLGVITPLLTAVAQQPRWSSRTRAIIGAIVSIAVGGVTCLAKGDITNGQTLLSTIAVVLVAAQATYSQLWKPTGVAGALENATSTGTPAGG